MESPSETGVSCETQMAPPPPRAFGGDTSPSRSLALTALGLRPFAADVAAKAADGGADSAASIAAISERVEELYDALSELLAALDAPYGSKATSGAQQAHRFWEPSEDATV